MSIPKTAIVVLSYNGLETTKKFLNDLYANTSDFLLIMVDNGSTDGSAKYIGKFAAKKDNMVFVANDTNLGVINGRNYGFQLFLGLENKPEYICFLDNDQFVQKGWLDHHHTVLEQSECDIVGVEAWLLDKKLWPVEQCKRFGGPWSYIGCGGMLMKSAIPEKIGLFDPQFNPCYFEDPDFCFRALESGYKLAWNYKPKLIHMAHQTLGKNPNRIANLKSSYAKFFAKWNGKRFREMRQFPIPILK